MLISEAVEYKVNTQNKPCSMKRFLNSFGKTINPGHEAALSAQDDLWENFSQLVKFGMSKDKSTS